MVDAFEKVSLAPPELRVLGVGESSLVIQLVSQRRGAVIEGLRGRGEGQHCRISRRLADDEVEVIEVERRGEKAALEMPVEPIQRICQM